MKEITKEWLKRILQISMETEDIDVLSINPITHNGFLSKAAKAEISIKTEKKEKLFMVMILSKILIWTPLKSRLTKRFSQN